MKYQLRVVSVERSLFEGDVEFIITVKEFVTPADPTMLFYAQADKQTNQKTIAYTPVGWGRTMLDALAEAIEFFAGLGCGAKIRAHRSPPEVGRARRLQRYPRQRG